MSEDYARARVRKLTEENERLRAEAEEQDGDAAAERARKYAARIDAALEVYTKAPYNSRVPRAEAMAQALKGEKP